MQSSFASGIVASIFAVAGLGCSDTKQSTADASSVDAPSAATGPDRYRRCDPEKRVGGFSVQLVAATMDAAAHTQVAGRVRSGVSPYDLWDTRMQAADCRLLTGPRLLCNPTCQRGNVCSRDNRCIAEPRSQSAGKITVSGLGAPVLLTPSPSGYFESLPATTPFPPATPGTLLRLSASGDEVPGFDLAAPAIEPLQFTADLGLARGVPVSVDWTPPKTATGARIGIVIDVAHHGGIAARIDCEVADVGTATVPAALVDALLDEGTAGFPMISLTRQFVDATTIGAGCVELAITSHVDRPISVAGVISCSDEMPCPDGRTCAPSRKCL